MEKSNIAVIGAFAIMALGALSGLSFGGLSHTYVSPAGTPALHPSPHLVSPELRSFSPSPLTTFPRTVLVETFTAVWCIHCPAESQALYYLDHTNSPNVLSIAELHVCASTSTCLENYVPPDGTSNARGAFYNVCGFPDVFFDGGHVACGASNSEPQMLGQYENSIANASMYPGNVSISQTASILTGNVTEQVAVDSGVTGSYNAVSYLMEYIGKTNVTNGYGPHSLANVVRATVYNHPLALTAGSTTGFTATLHVSPMWNPQNLSVVTFIQQNSTKIVENANMVPVSDLTTSVTATPSTIGSTGHSALTIVVTNTSTSAPVAGAQVSLVSSAGGSFSAASGMTASDGSFQSTFNAPSVTAVESIEISADVTAPGYLPGFGSTLLTVNPVAPPSAPRALSLSPGIQLVSLNWTAPATGGGGVTYHVYRATSASGPFSQIGTALVPTFGDPNVVTGKNYWYSVSAQNIGGFSANTSVLSASSVDFSSQGLPASVGWWLTIDSLTFVSATNASIVLHLPDGVYNYNFGAGSYMFNAPISAGTVSVAGAAVKLSAMFAPRYAILEGSVNPAGATVTLNGAAVSVVDGNFLQQLTAGTYTLHVAAPGYMANDTSVTLTPGNTTTLNFALTAVPATKNTPSSGGLSSDQIGLIVSGIGVAGIAALLGIMMLSRRKKGGDRSPPPTKP